MYAYFINSPIIYFILRSLTLRFVVHPVHYWMYMFNCLRVIVHSNLSQLFKQLKKSINMRIFIFYSTEYINNQSYSDSYNLCR